MKVLADGAAGVCVLMFLGAALGKLDRWLLWSELVDEIAERALLRRTVRFGVPTSEAAVVVLTVVAPTVGLAAGAIVLVTFSVSVWLLARRLAGRECNCFGAIAPATIGPQLAVRDAGLAVVLAGGWLLAHHEDLQALSFSKLLVIALIGAIALMLDQFRRLHRASRDAQSHLAQQSAIQNVITDP